MAFGFISLREAVDEVRLPTFWRDVIAEVLVAFFLLAMNTLVAAPLNHIVARPFLAQALVGGLYVYVLIESFGHIQLAAMNPVAVIIFVATKRLSFIKGVFYVLAELVGASAGTMIMAQCLPEGTREQYSAFHPGPGISAIQACVVELVLTLALSFVILGALDGDHPNKDVKSPGFAISVAVGMGIITGAPYSGGCMNPAISFGWSILARDWQYQWIYWSSDCLAGVLATALYFVFTTTKGPLRNRERVTKETKNGIKSDPQELHIYPPLMKEENGVSELQDGSSI